MKKGGRGALLLERKTTLKEHVDRITHENRQGEPDCGEAASNERADIEHPVRLRSGAIVAVLTAVAGLAAYVPAVRAARIEPMSALRES